MVSDTPSPPPDEAELREAALAHLARYATTCAGLIRVLDRRVERWSRKAGDEAGLAVETARRTVREVVARLAAAGAVDDAAFAESRVRTLARAGRSRRAVAAYLAQRGVAAETARAALTGDDETELVAALSLARRRRIGPFRRGEADAETLRRELGVLARAGFGQEIASRALRMEPAAAEALVLRLRRE
jgi:regulatory protein